MSQANSSILVAPAASGVPTATHEVGGRHFQAAMLADETGFIGERPRYRFISGASPVAANKTHCHLFNGVGSGKVMRILSVFVYPKIDTAVTGVVAVEVALARTSTDATNGTIVLQNISGIGGATVSQFDLDDPGVPTEIRFVLNPTTGMNNGAYLGSRWVFTEETNAGSAIAGALGADLIRNDGADLIVREGHGLRVAQGPVAGVGSISIEIDFELI